MILFQVIKEKGASLPKKKKTIGVRFDFTHLYILHAQIEFSRPI